MGTVASLFHSSPVLRRLIYKPQGTWSELCAIKIFSRQQKRDSCTSPLCSRQIHLFMGWVQLRCACVIRTHDSAWVCVQSFLICLLPMNKSVSPSIYVLRLNPEKTSSGGHWRFVFTSSETHSESASVLGGKNSRE